MKKWVAKVLVWIAALRYDPVKRRTNTAECQIGFLDQIDWRLHSTSAARLRDPHKAAVSFG